MKIEERVGVQAPAEVIWRVIVDLPRWKDWNPVYTQVSGVVGYGERLKMTLQLPGQPAMPLAPVVIDWVPNDQLHLGLSFAGGLVKSTRYIEIEPLTEAGCILSNGELFRGLGVRLIGRDQRRAIRAGFALMTEALKATAEADWAALDPAEQAVILAAAAKPAPPPLPKAKPAKQMSASYLKR